MRALRSTARHARAVLYLTTQAVDRLNEEALRRSRAAGVEVTPEAAARGLVYAGLGLDVDGIGEVARATATSAEPKATERQHVITPAFLAQWRRLVKDQHITQALLDETLAVLVKAYEAERTP